MPAVASCGAGISFCHDTGKATTPMSPNASPWLHPARDADGWGEVIDEGSLAGGGPSPEVGTFHLRESIRFAVRALRSNAVAWVAGMAASFTVTVLALAVTIMIVVLATGKTFSHQGDTAAVVGANFLMMFYVFGTGALVNATITTLSISQALKEVDGERPEFAEFSARATFGRHSCCSY